MFSTGLQEMMQKEVYSCVHLVEEMYAAGTGLSQKPRLFSLWEERIDERKGESISGSVFKLWLCM